MNKILFAFNGTDDSNFSCQWSADIVSLLEGKMKDIAICTSYFYFIVLYFTISILKSIFVFYNQVVSIHRWPLAEV